MTPTALLSLGVPWAPVRVWGIILSGIGLVAFAIYSLYVLFTDSMLFQNTVVKVSNYGLVGYNWVVTLLV